MQDKNSASKKNTVLAIVKFILLIVIIIGVPLYVYFFHKDLISNFNSFDEIVAFLRRYKTLSAFIFIGAQILQIIISVLPGQFFQFAAGYLYGFVPGVMLSLVGAALGTTITYFLAKILGSDAVHLMMGEEKTKHYVELLNSKKAYVITLIIYLIPGLPKDTVCYIAGVSDMNFFAFLIISLIGRLPAMCGTIIFGAMYMKGNYIGMVVVAVIVAIICVFCFIYRKRMGGIADNLYNRIK